MTDRLTESDFHPPDPGFFTRGVLQLAPDLLGCLLVHETSGGEISGVVTETEAYHQKEPSCHAYRGSDSRNWPMFRSGGLAYVYRIYGIHTCFNVCSGEEGTGEAVLVRYLSPVSGTRLMALNRGTGGEGRLCSGPGNLCRALGIDISMNGTDLRQGPLRILVPAREVPVPFSCTPRIGVTKAAELEWRFLAVNLEHR